MWKMSFPMFVSIVNDIREVGRSKSEFFSVGCGEQTVRN
jgi:hypothetical protein